MTSNLKINLSITSPNEMLSDKNETLIIGIQENGNSQSSKNIFNKASKGLMNTLLKRKEFSGKVNTSCYVPALADQKDKKFFLLGLGNTSDKFKDDDASKLITKICTLAKTANTKKVSLFLPEIKFEKRDFSWFLQNLSMQLESSTYKYIFDGKKEQKNNILASVNLLINSKKDITDLRKSISIGANIGVGINRMKELGNTPANICTPTYLGNTAKDLGRKYKNLSVKVLGEKEMEKLGMHCLLSVGNGSVQESKFIIIEYKGGKKTEQPEVIVGKGITFDTGGISLKPSPAMDEMKYDMSGAASVLGTMEAIALIKPKSNIIGVVASAENMPGSKATKPGDVVKTMSGQTVEILNTDAEGRLVLCDALTYVERFKPKNVIDIATLTGAVIVALGHVASGLMSNNQKLADKIIDAGHASMDKAWQLPLWDEYQGDLDSNFADIANIGGRAGTITAACFLSRFTKKYPWAHLDVAGTAHGSGKAKASRGRPVPLLTNYLLSQS